MAIIMSIQDWPETERPREKLRHRGASSLSDAELLAIFLRCGVPGMSAVDMARMLINEYGSIGALLNAPEHDFIRHKGLGPAKYTQFMALNELARRVLAENFSDGDILDHPQAVRNYLRWRIGRRETEVFAILFLSNQNRVLAIEEVANGSLAEVQVHPREIVRHALRHNAAAVIAAHNHPSGNTRPSTEDRQLTERLKAALALLDIRLHDHFIVTRTETVSFAEHGWL